MAIFAAFYGLNSETMNFTILADDLGVMDIITIFSFSLKYILDWRSRSSKIKYILLHYHIGPTIESEPLYQAKDFTILVEGFTHHINSFSFFKHL